MVKLFNKKPGKKQREEVRTKIEVITVGDTPPIVEARKLIGDNNPRAAIINSFNAVKGDYIRFFGLKQAGRETARQFLARSFREMNVNVPEDSMMDSVIFLDSVKSPPANLPKEMESRFTVLKKITSFCLNYYERAKFSDPMEVDEGKIIEKLEDIYTYMDITKLYFPYGKVTTRAIGDNDQAQASVEDKVGIPDSTALSGAEADAGMIEEMLKSGIINQEEYESLISKVNGKETETNREETGQSP